MARAAWIDRCSVSLVNRLRCKQLSQRNVQLHDLGTVARRRAVAWIGCRLHQGYRQTCTQTDDVLGVCRTECVCVCGWDYCCRHGYSCVAAVKIELKNRKITRVVGEKTSLRGKKKRHSVGRTVTTVRFYPCLCDGVVQTAP